MLLLDQDLSVDHLRVREFFPVKYYYYYYFYYYYYYYYFKTTGKTVFLPDMFTGIIFRRKWFKI